MANKITNSAVQCSSMQCMEDSIALQTFSDVATADRYAECGCSRQKEAGMSSGFFGSALVGFIWTEAFKTAPAVWLGDARIYESNGDELSLVPKLAVEEYEKALELIKKIRAHFEGAYDFVEIPKYTMIEGRLLRKQGRVTEALETYLLAAEQFADVIAAHPDVLTAYMEGEVSGYINAINSVARIHEEIEGPAADLAKLYEQAENSLADWGMHEDSKEFWIRKTMKRLKNDIVVWLVAENGEATQKEIEHTYKAILASIEAELEFAPRFFQLEGERVITADGIISARSRFLKKRPSLTRGEEATLGTVHRIIYSGKVRVGPAMEMIRTGDLFFRARAFYRAQFYYTSALQHLGIDGPLSLRRNIVEASTVERIAQRAYERLDMVEYPVLNYRKMMNLLRESESGLAERFETALNSLLGNRRTTSKKIDPSTISKDGLIDLVAIERLTGKKPSYRTIERMAEAYKRDGFTNEAIKAFEYASELAQDAHDPAEAVRLLRRHRALSMEVQDAFMGQNERRSELIRLSRAATEAREAGDLNSEGRAHLNRAYLMEGNYPKLKVLGDAYRCFMLCGSTGDMMLVTEAASVVLQKMGRIGDSVDLHRIAYFLAQPMETGGPIRFAGRPFVPGTPNALGVEGEGRPRALGSGKDIPRAAGARENEVKDKGRSGSGAEEDGGRGKKDRPKGRHK